MLIVSRFHDYYDSITSYGIDKTVVYARRTKEIQGWALRLGRDFSFPEQRDTQKIRHRGNLYEYDIRCFLIGFCGSLYPGVSVSKKFEGSKKAHIEFFYDTKSLNSCLKREGLDSHSILPHGWNHSAKNKVNFDAYFNSRAWDTLKEQFALQKTSIFLYGRLAETYDEFPHESKLVLNPCLKEFDFVRVKPPVVAFQEIYMFISGVLGMPERTMVKISDAKLAEKKGHGGKYSFRKPPKDPR